MDAYLSPKDCITKGFVDLQVQQTFFGMLLQNNHSDSLCSFQIKICGIKF